MTSQRKPPRYRVEFVPDWRFAPLAYWVHAWSKEETAGTTLAAAPGEVPHRGYRCLWVEVADIELCFTSAAQLAHCIDVLTRVPLPTTRRLSSLRPGSTGPNAHWLSRLPARLKQPRARAKVVLVLQSIPAAVWTAA